MYLASHNKNYGYLINGQMLQNTNAEKDLI